MLLCGCLQVGVLLSELFADGLQFLAPRLVRFRIIHPELFQRIEDDLRNDQPGVLFVIGGDDIPGCGCGARCTQACLIRLPVVIPQFPLSDVSETEFPVLRRFINALEQALSLFVLRQVEEELDDPGAITMEMFLQVHDGTIPILPNGLVLLVEQFMRKSLGTKNLRMHANDEHLLVVGTIEDADPPAFRQMAGCAPEKIMFQLVSGCLLYTSRCV